MERGSPMGDCVLNSGGQAGSIDLSIAQPVGLNGEQKIAASPPQPGLSSASPFRLPRRSRFLILPIASVLLPIMMVVVGGWIGWRATWVGASDQLGHEADAGAEYASRVLAGYVVATGRINDMLRGLSDQQIREHEAEIHTTLGQLVAELPQANDDES